MSGFRRALRRTFRIGFGVGGLALLAYPFVFTDTEFINQETTFNRELLAMSGKYLKSYRPAFLFTGGLGQACYNSLLSADGDLNIVYNRHLLTMSDGGTISLDWAKP